MSAKSQLKGSGVAVTEGEAATWADAGFSLNEVVQLAPRMKLSTAMLWIKSGYSANQAVAWHGRGYIQPPKGCLKRLIER